MLRPKFSVFLSAAVLGLIGAASAAPSGKIGFIGPRGAAIWHLSGGKIQTLPGAARADTLAFSPRGTAVFWVPPRQDSGPLARATPHQAFLSRPPYRSSRPILSLENSDVYNYGWNAVADTLYLSSYQMFGAYSPRRDTLRQLKFQPYSFDASGRKMGYQSEGKLMVRDMMTGKDRVIMSIQHPKPIFDALRRARNPRKLAGLLTGETAPKNQPLLWQLFGPALSPDGKRAYFSTNAGTDIGASDNALQGIFVCDLATDSLSFLNAFGPAEGSSFQLSVSPDGRHLLAIVSTHDSATDDSSVAELIDLRAQSSRDLLISMPGSKGKGSFYGGSAWSPDGKYLALSAYFYDVAAATKSFGMWAGPKNSDWKTAIFDVASGKIWGIKQGMHKPGWSR